MARLEIGDSEKKRGDAPCAPAEERPACLFPASDFLHLFRTSYHGRMSIHQVRSRLLIIHKVE
ncbi:hypothetical protein HMPREF0083_05202, partial [Aneurinibacillus aneurinilyticus ATCC 12856]